MATSKLTKTLIDQTAPGAKDQIVFDQEIKGLALKITPTGNRSFLLIFRNANGQQRKLKIGNYPEITIKQARDEALRLKVEVMQGIDPLAVKQEKRQSLTLNEFAKTYFDQASKKASTLAMEKTNYRNHIENSLGKKQLTSLGLNEVQSWFRAMKETPGVANRTLSMLGAMLSEAERQGLRELGTNPVRLIKRYPSKKVERCLTLEELDRLGAVLRDMEKEKMVSPSAIAAIRLLLLTGARKSEILELKWEQIDWDRRVFDLADSKTGPRSVHLPHDALEILKNLPRLDSNPYVLPGRLPGDHFTGLRKPFLQILELADIKDCRIHDLRHTVGSYAGMGGHSVPLIAKLMGHKQLRTSERYIHIDYNPVQQASDAVANTIASALRGENPSLS